MESKKIVLIFGAGASYDSSTEINRPPLARNLFDELCKVYPETWGKIDEEDKNKFKDEYGLTKNFESGLSYLYSTEGQNKYNFNILLREFAIYFDRFTITDPSNNLYCKFINRFKRFIVEHKIIIATLNYDCLLEYACMYSGIKTISYRGVDSHPKILKIHGSINFIPQNIFGRQESIDLGTAKVDTQICPCMPGTVKQHLENIPIPPAISLFVEGKTDIVSPRFIKDIRDEYKNYVDASQLCISIGVRPNEIDHHVWSPLKKVEKLFLVGGNDCEEWCQNNSNSEYLGKKFSLQYKEICKIIEDNLS